MPRALRAVDQIAMDEQVIQDDALLTELESWENARAEASAAREVSKKAKERAIAALEQHPVELGQSIRVGRFRVTRRFVKGGERSFTAADRETVELALVTED